jgi:hypothetical protein
MTIVLPSRADTKADAPSMLQAPKDSRSRARQASDALPPLRSVPTRAGTERPAREKPALRRQAGCSRRCQASAFIVLPVLDDERFGDGRYARRTGPGRLELLGPDCRTASPSGSEPSAASQRRATRRLTSAAAWSGRGVRQFLAYVRDDQPSVGRLLGLMFVEVDPSDLPGAVTAA